MLLARRLPRSACMSALHAAMHPPCCQNGSIKATARCTWLSPLRRRLAGAPHVRCPGPNNTSWCQPRLPSHGARPGSSVAAGGSGANGGKIGGGGNGVGSGGAGDAQPGRPSGLWGAYLRALEASPVLTKVITSALINLLGNLFSQLVVEDAGQLDLKRVAVFTAIGGLWVAPVLHVWYMSLSRLVPAATNAGALMRMAADQLGFAPVFTASMMALILTAEGKPDQVGAQLRSDWAGAVRANWALWVPVQFLNFRFVPVNFQVLVANVAAFFWGAYFSWVMRPKAVAVTE